MPEFEFFKMLEWTLFGIVILFILIVAFSTCTERFMQIKNNAKLNYLKKWSEMVNGKTEQKTKKGV